MSADFVLCAPFENGVRWSVLSNSATDQARGRVDIGMDATDVRDIVAAADPVELERQGWQALSTSGDAAVAFYREVLDDSPLMLLPGGAVLSDTTTVLETMSGPPWSRYELGQRRRDVGGAPGGVRRAPALGLDPAHLDRTASRPWRWG